MNSRSTAFFKEASKNLNVAKDELFKPAEDIVSYSVCKNAQYAVENFLKGFLIKNKVKIEVEDTIATLFDKCVKVDPNFKEIELTAIGCKNDTIDSRYCSEINKISACYDTADNIDTYLRKNKVL